MARLIYGGTPADLVVAAITVIDDNNDARTVPALAGGVPLQVWTARTGGTQITDLLDLAAATLPGGMVTTDADGRLPYFLGPDGYVADLYVLDPVLGNRYRIAPGGLAQRVADLETAGITNAVTLDGVQTITGPKVLSAENPAASALVIDRSATVDATVAEDVFVVFYKGQRAVWFNEWGGVRCRVPTVADLGYGDVALQLWGRAGNDTLQLFASTDGSTPSFRVREGDVTTKGLTATAPITAAAAASAAATILNGAGQWQDMTTYANGFSAYASTTQYTPKARLEPGGDRVRLRGRLVADGAIALNEAICTLPAGLRPARTVQVWAMTSTGSVTELDVAATGVITNQRALSATWVSLDDVSFYIGAN